MRHEGRLKKWNEERGFGFITADKDGIGFFVHISAFPPGERNPKIGERLSFEIDTGPDGKKRATRISCPERTATRSAKMERHGSAQRAVGREPSWHLPQSVLPWPLTKNFHPNSLLPAPAQSMCSMKNPPHFLPHPLRLISNAMAGSIVHK